MGGGALVGTCADIENLPSERIRGVQSREFPDLVAGIAHEARKGGGSNCAGTKTADLQPNRQENTRKYSYLSIQRLLLQVAARNHHLCDGKAPVSSR